MLIGWENLPRKTMSSGALFLNKEGKFIITNPNYKEGWNVPGGMVDPNESPVEAFKREVKEELGLDKDAIRLLCVEYRRTSAGHDHVNFVFDGGVLTDDEIANIKLQEAELTEYRFVSPDEGMALLSEGWGTRMIESLKARAAHTIVYLENGKEMGKSSQ